MPIVQAFIQGFHLLRRHFYCVWIIYIVTLSLALLFILPFHSVLVTEIGQSLEIRHMLEAYRHTVVADFLNVAGKQIFTLIGQIKWILLLYVFVSIFFSAGLMFVFTQTEKGVNLIIKGGLKFFWRYLKLTACIWSLQLLIAIIFYGPFLTQAMGGLDGIHHEINFFRLGFVGMAIHIPIAVFLFALADFAKAHLVVNQEKSVLKALWQVIKIFRAFFSQTYLLYVLNGLLIACIYGIYLLLADWIGMSLGHTIFMVFILQQLISIMRIAAKVVRLGSTFSMLKQLSPQHFPQIQ